MGSVRMHLALWEGTCPGYRWQEALGSHAHGCWQSGSQHLSRGIWLGCLVLPLCRMLPWDFGARIHACGALGAFSEQRLRPLRPP